MTAPGSPTPREALAGLREKVEGLRPENPNATRELSAYDEAIRDVLALPALSAPDAVGESHDNGDAHEITVLMNGMEAAWGIIANASKGCWNLQDEYWQEAAARWRDEHWHPSLDRNGYPDRVASAVGLPVRETGEGRLSDEVRQTLALAEKALWRQHRWHLEQNAPDPAFGFIPADEYGDSTMYVETDDALSALDWVLRQAPAGHPSGTPQCVRTPTNEDEAALMVLLGENWLRENAPHRLRVSPISAPPPVEESGARNPFASHDKILWCIARLAGHADGRISDEEIVRSEGVRGVCDEAWKQLEALASAPPPQVESGALEADVRLLAIEAIEAVLTMKCDKDPPRKLDDALSWRQNDELALAKATRALAALRAAVPEQREPDGWVVKYWAEQFKDGRSSVITLQRERPGFQAGPSVPVYIGGTPPTNRSEDEC